MFVVVDDFTTWISGDWVIVMARSSVSGADWVESAMTVLSRSPSPPPFESSSAWVTMWLQLKIQVSPIWSLLSALVSPET